MRLLGFLFGFTFGWFSGQLFKFLVLSSAAPLGWLGGLMVWTVGMLLIFWLIAFSIQSSVPVGTPAGLFNSPLALRFFQGFSMGNAAIINAIIYFALPGLTATVLGYVALLPALMPIGPIRHNKFYQGFLGWMSWAMPISWLANIFGLLLFLVLGIPLWIGQRASIRLDPHSGVIETSLPLPISPGFPAFCLGTFTFFDSSRLPAATLGAPFTGPTLSAHEIGHTLDISGMTIFYAAACAMELMRVSPPFFHVDGIGEMSAESNARRPGSPYVDIWAS